MTNNFFIFFYLFRHFRRALGALLVYDVKNEKSYVNAKRWMEDLKYQSDENVVIILVGNKIDLIGKDDFVRKIDNEEAKCFANLNNLLFQETSAFTPTNVTEVFETLIEGK